MDPNLDPNSTQDMDLGFEPDLDQDEQPSTYLGTYKTKEEAEAGLLEKDRTISRLMNQTQQVESEASRVARLMEAFAAEPTPAYTPVETAQVGQPFPWEQELPDPVEQPAQFKAALARQISTADERAYQRIRVESQRQAQAGSQIDRMWEYFQGAYPDLADKEELVAAAWMQQTGGRIPRDPRQLPSILAGVAQQARSSYQKYTGQAPQASQQTNQETRAFIPTRGRTSVASGFQGGPGQGPTQTPEREKPGSFTDELKEYQKKQGYR